MCLLCISSQPKRKPSTFENILGVTQMYARHLGFIFGISAIYLEAAHKQNLSRPMHSFTSLGIHFCASV